MTPVVELDSLHPVPGLDQGTREPPITSTRIDDEAIGQTLRGDRVQEHRHGMNRTAIVVPNRPRIAESAMRTRQLERLLTSLPALTSFFAHKRYCDFEPFVGRLSCWFLIVCAEGGQRW